MNSKTRRFWLGTCVGLLLSSASAVTGPTQEQLNNADTATDSWLMYNKGYKAQRYSSLDQINADNVAQMKRSCTFETGDDGGFQVTPQMYNGVLFFTQANRTFAVDARTCKALWVHKYMMDTSSVMMTNRGVAIADGVIYRGTPNAHLIALDAGTGKQLWDTKVADSTLGYFLSAAPIYYNGKILIGEAGADWGVKAHMYAFDAKTGKKAWTFDLIPTGSQKGAEPGSVPPRRPPGAGAPGRATPSMPTRARCTSRLAILPRTSPHSTVLAITCSPIP
jgi:alcohol dehydrogenase (cytochrome c)